MSTTSDLITPLVWNWATLRRSGSALSTRMHSCVSKTAHPSVLHLEQRWVFVSDASPSFGRIQRWRAFAPMTSPSISNFDSVALNSRLHHSLTDDCNTASTLGREGSRDADNCLAYPPNVRFYSTSTNYHCLWPTTSPSVARSPRLLQISRPLRHCVINAESWTEPRPV